jgi:hypothetical protein
MAEYAIVKVHRHERGLDQSKLDLLRDGDDTEE